MELNALNFRPFYVSQSGKKSELKRKINFICTGHYNYRCSNDYCSINKSVCDLTRLNNLEKKKLKSCANEKTTVFQSFSLLRVFLVFLTSD